MNAGKKLIWKLFLIIASFYGCKDDTTVSEIEQGQVTDAEGNVYRTVKIGDQWWMAENLRTRTFNTGDPVPFILSTDSAGWVNGTQANCCLYQDNPDAPGLLYNQAAVADPRGIAPTGWHIATDADWQKLERFIGLTSAEANETAWRGSNEGDKLKKEGLNAWVRYDGVWAGDDYKFSAQAGGCRLPDNRYSVPSSVSFAGFWWTATAKQQGESWYRYIDYKSSRIFRSYTYDGYGMSIRCVKD